MTLDEKKKKGLAGGETHARGFDSDDISRQ
jgi:hypothetical protein